MKKTSLIILIIVLIAAILPIIGNSVVETALQDKIAQLKTFGLDTENEKTQSGYLKTKKHYEFVLSDSKQLIAYLNQYSTKQLPSYVDAVLQGTRVGMDVEYYNLPFTKAISIDIYPLALSKELVSGMKKANADFYQYFKTFLESKGVLYHINYNIVSKDFDGYIKDIDEKYDFKEQNTTLKWKMDGVTYDGSGDLIAPEHLAANINNISIAMESEANGKVILDLHKLHTTTNFESQLTYMTTFDLEDMKIYVNDKYKSKKESAIIVKQMKVNFSSNDQGKDLELFSKTSIKHFTLSSLKSVVKIDDFKYDIALEGVEKNAAEILRSLIAKASQGAQATARDEAALTQSIEDILGHGFKLKVGEFSLGNITLVREGKLGGFDAKLDFTLKQTAFKLPAKELPFEKYQANSEFTMNLKFSKKFIKAFKIIPPAAEQIAKVKGDKYIYDVVFDGKNLTINGTKF